MTTQIESIDQQIRADRNARIIKLHESGVLHAEIAERLGHDVGFVRETILVHHRDQLGGGGILFGQMVAAHGRAVWALPAPDDDEELQAEEIRKAIRAARTYGYPVMISVAIVSGGVK